MRLQRFTQFGFGVAAAGAAAVFLSGGALAADASSLGDVTQSLPLVQAGPLNIGKAAKNFTLPDSGSSANQDSSNKLNQPGADKAGLTPTSSNSTTETSGDSKATVQSTTNSSDSGDGTKSGTADNSGGSTTVTPAAKATGNESGSSDEGNISGKAAVTAGSGSKPEVIAPAAVETTPDPAQPVAPVVSYHSVWLRVQPVISNHPAEADLATAMPSAPVANKAPVPAKSNGTLGELTVMLAASVVPQLLHPIVDGAYRLALPGLLILVLLATAVFVFTYGLWLRRGGFATAARSDVPASKFFSPFATPLSLGYVWMLSRQQHSPILLQVVYEILKPNRFPALSERRIYV